MAKEAARSNYEEGIEDSFFSPSLLAVHGVRNLRSDSLSSSISRAKAPKRLARKRKYFLFFFAISMC